jgi:hypothetical protein
MGGGSDSGAGGGGGGSGTVDYPAYLKTVHNDWLDNTGSDLVTQSITDCINAAFTGNPFTGLAAFNPDDELNVMIAALGDLETLVDAINYHTDYDTILAAATSAIDTTLVPESYIVALIAAQSDVLDTEYNGKIYPAFEAGMRDINSVHTSSFVLGRSLLATERGDKMDKFAADLRLQNHAKRADLITQAVSEMLRLMIQKVELTRAWTSMTIDANRLVIAAKGDEVTEDKVLDVGEAKWDLEVWQYGANLLAAIGGGTASPQKIEGNQMARVVGGALSGASAGALIGSRVGGEGGYGGAIGAVVGGLAGLAGGLA